MCKTGSCIVLHAYQYKQITITIITQRNLLSQQLRKGRKQKRVFKKEDLGTGIIKM